MALFNAKRKPPTPDTTNLAGGEAYAQSPEMALVSLLLSSFVQDQFYRSAENQLGALNALLRQVDPLFAAKAAVYARQEFGMRSISHALAVDLLPLASGQVWAKGLYNRVVRRPDDMLEMAALAKAKGCKHLPNAMKKGFAEAFDRFDGYQLAKYRGEGRAVKLVDLVNLIHPVPTVKNAEALQLLVKGALKNTQTWEAKLSDAGQQAQDDEHKQELKGQAWAELLQSGKLGYLAMLRNLRNLLEQAPELAPLVAEKLCDAERIRKSLVMPFQLMTAMDALAAVQPQASGNALSQVLQAVKLKAAAPSAKRIMENALTDALELSVSNVPRFSGRTLVVIDDSGSMATAVRSKGFTGRSCIQLGAVFAAALFKANDADLMRFSDDASFIRANSRDSLMSIAQGIINKAKAGGTNFHAIFQRLHTKYERIIILSDMQGWIGHATPEAAYQAYKQRCGANPFIYSFDLAGYGSSQFPEGKVFCISGFQEKVFDLMKMLETDRKAVIRAINAVEL